MDPTIVGYLGLGAMLFLVALRIPIAFCMALVGFVGMMVVVGCRHAELESRRLQAR